MKYIIDYNKYVLLESNNKIDVLKTKFKDISDDVFDKLVDSDPSQNKAYLNWILNTYNKSDNKKVFIEDLYKVKQYLETFDSLKKQHKIEHTDINYYSDYKELFNDISKIGGTGNPTEDENYLLTDRYYLNNGEAELFNENTDYLIVIPKTLDASKFYAKKTEWCTQYPDNFNEYSKQGNLYIIIDKHLINTNNVNRRLQFHFQSNQFMDFNDEDLMANIKSKFLFIFKNIKENWKLKYDEIWNFKNGFVRVKLNDKYGFVNTKGIEICPIKYDYVWSFENEFAQVELNGKYGLINESGDEICEIKYDKIWNFLNGFAAVKLNNKWGFIDKSGKEICPIKYDWTWNFNNGFAKVELNQKTLYIDEQGNEYAELPNK